MQKEKFLGLVEDVYGVREVSASLVPSKDPRNPTVRVTFVTADGWMRSEELPYTVLLAAVGLLMADDDKRGNHDTH